MKSSSFPSCSQNSETDPAFRSSHQDVVRKAETIMKELAVQEKKQVQLEEKKKHGINQQKKLKKSVSEVSFVFRSCVRILRRS